MSRRPHRTILLRKIREGVCLKGAWTTGYGQSTPDSGPCESVAATPQRKRRQSIGSAKGYSGSREGRARFWRAFSTRRRAIDSRPRPPCWSRATSSPWRVTPVAANTDLHTPHTRWGVPRSDSGGTSRKPILWRTPPPGSAPARQGDSSGHAEHLHSRRGGASPARGRRGGAPSPWGRGTRVSPRHSQPRRVRQRSAALPAWGEGPRAQSEPSHPWPLTCWPVPRDLASAEPAGSAQRSISSRSRDHAQNITGPQVLASVGMPSSVDSEGMKR
jgi:hypothetical protein